MVVDDSLTERQLLSRLLSRNGYEVVTATSGEEAMEKCKTDPPDLILIDVMMPALNGFQVTKALTRDVATRHIPIIICSGKGQEIDRVWGLRQGARDYVTKPVNPIELLAKIKDLALESRPSAQATVVQTQD
jgi:twitching motility two-component system response regulator PilH